MTKEDKVEEFLRTVEKNKLGMEDTFKFGCKQCGACCRKCNRKIYAIIRKTNYQMQKGKHIFKVCI